ncbi:Anaerobic glycerol-3-phosphate dehydrogenase subunit B [Sporomusa silvacetica DSM 10669]|uniref:Anaerobic glycerol-3-phosphate dehydrogenase subunit B n=1 Tax=Sporomusa silvacetica DSM 10669 TaxID=1123289 RepID=A0ABZ3IQF7_9FIRM|nr:anaerobic glycerol-3-phosphate dehydrogenase subunit GlpB [Sporomusa silvacetica]OZC20427.1 anaerobic glycerol-3-phosphate dehydrogenase subunit B [Sporomusa silvacetica DSM 10669]
MRISDVIVIGGGLAGLTAAITAAGRGKGVTLMTSGAGTLAIGGGTIDLLGYLENNTLVTTPRAGLRQLPPEHPYSKVGSQVVEEAVQFFLTMCQEEGFRYTGGLDHVQWLPTAIGSVKPSCLVPLTMDSTPIQAASHVVVVGFTRLKDYFPELISKGLGNIPGFQKEYEEVMIDPGFTGGRDVTTLDIARWLDTIQGQQACREQLAKQVKPGSAVIIPPVLGSRPSYVVRDALERMLACKFVEVVIMPTAVVGLRLRAMLLQRAKRLGVTIMEQAHVAYTVQEGKQVTAVVTGNIDRERSYPAKAVILATGGFFGGGIIAEHDSISEPIFNLPVTAPTEREEWGTRQLFANAAQPFAKIGIQVDDGLRPVNADGQVLLENVYIAGRNLAGYDHCLEKSGNGVALVSGYKAGLNC